MVPVGYTQGVGVDVILNAMGWLHVILLVTWCLLASCNLLAPCYMLYRVFTCPMDHRAAFNVLVVGATWTL